MSAFAVQLHPMIGKYIYLFLQRTYWPLLRAVLFRVYRVHVYDPSGILERVPKSTIIISNHRTPLDPFILSIIFPWNSRVYPVRFMAEFRKFEIPKIEFLRKIGLIYVVYFLFGAFSSRRGEGIERALMSPIYFLRKKESVMIFPEGSMMRGDELGKIHRGAGILATRTDRPVLPFGLKYHRGEYYIHIGEIFTMDSHLTEQESTTKIHDALSLLFASLNSYR